MKLKLRSFNRDFPGCLESVKITMGQQNVDCNQFSSWTSRWETAFVTELCVLRTFEGVDFSLIFICAQSVPEFLWDRLRASIQFPLMPKRAQYARFSGEYNPHER